MSAAAEFLEAVKWVSVHFHTENKDGLLMLDFLPIYSFTQPVCDRPQHTVIHSTKQKAADALSGR